MSVEETPTVGAEAEQSTETNIARRPLSARRAADDARLSVLPTIEDVDSAKSLTPTSTSPPSQVDYSAATSPYSAFYCHPTTRYSFDVQKTECKPIIDVYTVDVEDLEQSRVRSYGSPKTGNCTVWPGQGAKRNKFTSSTYRKRAWNPMRGLQPKTRIWLKIIIALAIISAAIGIGIGISKAVGAGLWKNSNGT